MKTSFISFIGITLITAINSSALANPNRSTDMAKVIHSKPVYETIERRIPRESCWTETVREATPRRSNSKTPTLIGGIIGGVIGNEVGRGGDNKKIGAVVGSILGMSIGNDIGRNHRTRNSSHVQYREVERCETTHTIQTEQKLTGYDVNYRYHGKTYSTFMKQDPGAKLRVAVEVVPITQ